MSFEALPAELRGLVGPEADFTMLDRALRYCGGIDPDLNKPHSAYCFTGKTTSPEHHCQLAGDVYKWCARIPAGGLACCEICGTPIFVPPETCTERVEEPGDEITAASTFDDRRAS